MRPIKFRAWNGEDKIMRKVLSVNFFQDSNIAHIVLDKKEGVITLFNDFILMQFTGLSDKNGKEIYEGDIVETAGGQKLKVYFEDGLYFPFYVKGIDKSKLKVIGNIYENPEL